jgi:CMP-N-acetylneuraminic acid synthetase
MTKRLCIIPVRAGSKGLPDKNIRDFRGKPLVVHSIDQALASGIFAEIVVSSDSEAYLDVARQAGATCCLPRPAELASDTAGSMEVIQHALAACERAKQRRYDTITLLQATSPLREARHVQEAVARLEDHGQDSVLSVTPAKNSPYFNLLEFDPDSGSFVLSKSAGEGVRRRQDAPEVYQLNGSIYVWSREALLLQNKAICARTDVYVMPALNSVDIDTEDDWAFAELAAELMEARKAHEISTGSRVKG